MSEYHATVKWSRNGQDFLGNKYSRLHEWQFDGKQVVNASASPHIVPPPWADGDRIDPEEAFVASLSSCHMLFFLALAAKQGLSIEEYSDSATGLLTDRGDGKLAMAEVVLKPRIRFTGEATPEPAQIEALHHAAHEHCFIANSVHTKVTVDSGSD